MYITVCPTLDVVHDERVGGDQRDRSSTAAASFNQDSEPIGQISTQLYVNSLQSAGSCSLARWGPQVSTEKQARSGKKGSGLGAFNTLLDMGRGRLLAGVSLKMPAVL
jgi:hypothetical protein